MEQQLMEIVQLWEEFAGGTVHQRVSRRKGMLLPPFPALPTFQCTQSLSPCPLLCFLCAPVTPCFVLSTLDCNL